MRTTLTLEPEIARELKRLAREENKPFKEVVNRTLRSGLDARKRQGGRRRRFRVEARACGFRPGVDTRRLNQLVDELAVDELLKRSVRPKS
jgi:hypothetical protein